MLSFEKFIIRYRNDVYFGLNTIENIRDIIQIVKPSNVLIITGSKSAKITGALDKVVNTLQEFNIKYEIYSGIKPNPTIDQIREGVEICYKTNPDALIAIGGGSVIDATKAISVCYCSKVDIKYLLYEKTVPKCTKPIIAINLTHGTGSEIDRYAVITDPETRIKKSIAHDSMYPIFSIDDPNLTITLPKDQTVYTAIDAFYHAIESATTKYTSPFTRKLSQEVIQLIIRYLPIAYEDGNNIEARYWLLYASMIAGICIDNSRAHLVHAVEHAISGIKLEIAHGLGLAVLGPKLIEYTFSKNPDYYVEILKPVIPDLKPKPEDAFKVKEFLEKFVEKFGIKCTLSYLGFGIDDVREIVELTYKASKHILGFLPFEIKNEEIERLLKEII